MCEEDKQFIILWQVSFVIKKSSKETCHEVDVALILRFTITYKNILQIYSLLKFIDLVFIQTENTVKLQTKYKGHCIKP